MKPRNHGSGVRLLAELAGVSPDEIRSDPKAFAAGLKALGDKAVELIRQVHSEDPAERAAAEQRLERLRARVEEGPSPGDVFRAKIRQALDEAKRRLEEAD